MAEQPDLDGFNRKLLLVAKSEFFTKIHKDIAARFQQYLVQDVLNRPPDATGPIPGTSPFIRNRTGMLQRAQQIKGFGPFASQLISDASIAAHSPYVGNLLKDRTGKDWFQHTATLYGPRLLEQAAAEFVRMVKSISRTGSYTYRNPYL